MQKESNKGRLLIGVILIIVGGLYLLQNMFPYEVQLPYWLTDNIFRWPSIPLVIGAAVLLSNHNRPGGFILVGVGLIGLFPGFWPLLLIGLGGYILFRKKRPFDDIDQDEVKKRVKFNQVNDPDAINDYAIFGGGKKIFQSMNFKGGSLISIFGGSEIDLTNSELADGDNIIEIVAIFGGSQLIVPREWNVEIDMLPILGGFSDKRIKDPNRVYSTDKRLVIKGIAIFGGGEVKN